VEKEDEEEEEEEEEPEDEDVEMPLTAKAMFDKKGRLRKEFLENEAELSGSEEEISDDEDERGLDRYGTVRYRRHLLVPEQLNGTSTKVLVGTGTGQWCGSQCFGSGSALNPYSAASGIRIRDPYSECASRIRIQWFSFDFFSVPTGSGFNSQMPICSYYSLQKSFSEDNIGFSSKELLL